MTATPTSAARLLRAPTVAALRRLLAVSHGQPRLTIEPAGALAWMRLLALLVACCAVFGCDGRPWYSGDMLTIRFALLFPLALFFGVMLSAACETHRPDSETSDTSASTSTTDPTTSEEAQLAEPCGWATAPYPSGGCSDEYSCQDGVWCDGSVKACLPFSPPCDVDADCAAIGGHPQTCNSYPNEGMICSWPCDDDSDCPTSFAVPLRCTNRHCSPCGDG